ncbi:hypothetical protein [Paraburkholderia pallida]|uniref:Uncharacterized protein n=1 Tax=Paraburkholderia pallida TaxID=2547399 RepID=A0A4P7D7K3_9BURK|nr:hypothetical protein [Paraburkholderia pallida]QBR02935.1 hypothetical protein E1956_37685 [Paraburkholderia pallida]
MTSEWQSRRIKLFVQRFWQPTSACMTCMPGSWANVLSVVHWAIAFRTGVITGALAVLLTFTPAAKLYENRYGNALVIGCLTALGDALSHTSHYHNHVLEHLLTGAMSGLFALAASFLLEDRARRIRVVWGRLFE